MHYVVTRLCLFDTCKLSYYKLTEIELSLSALGEKGPGSRRQEENIL